jgi:competence protein ComEA
VREIGRSPGSAPASAPGGTAQPASPAPSSELSPAPEPFEPGGEEPEAPAPESPAAPAVPDAEQQPPEQPLPGAPSGEPLNLNTATYDELRTLRLSVTQTGRVLAHRERVGRFQSVDELEQIPGFPTDFLAALKPHLTV